MKRWHRLRSASVACGAACSACGFRAMSIPPVGGSQFNPPPPAPPPPPKIEAPVVPQIGCAAAATTTGPRRGLPSATGSARCLDDGAAGGLRSGRARRVFAQAAPIGKLFMFELLSEKRCPLSGSRSISVLGEKHPQGIVRALDVGNHPAVGSVDQDEIQRDRAAVDCRRRRRHRSCRIACEGWISRRRRSSRSGSAPGNRRARSSAELHALRKLGSKNWRAVAASCGSPLERSGRARCRNRRRRSGPAIPANGTRPRRSRYRDRPAEPVLRLQGSLPSPLRFICIRAYHIMRCAN